MNEQFLTQVATSLARADLLRPDATLLLAISGGADSVTLLHALCALRARHGFTVRAAHVEHGLRGEASLADADFCGALCAQHNVPFTLDHAGLAGAMDDPGTETRARDARYRLLLARAKQCHADALLLAHHLDDQAETLLAHLLRGSGARGLSGMREVTRREGVTLVRPLLSLSRQTLLTALDGLPYRTDASNLSPCCQRNRLRQTVLPLLTAENPRAVEHIAQSATLLALDEDHLQTQADTLLRTALLDRPPILCLHKQPLLAAPPPITVRALRAFVALGIAYCTGSAQANRPDAHIPLPEQALSATDSLSLLKLISAPDATTLNLPHALCATITQHYLHLTRMEKGKPICPQPVPVPVALTDAPPMLPFGDLTLHLTPFDPATTPAPDGKRTLALPTSQLAQVTLRTPLPGDRIHPFGASGSKPLRRYLIDRKVDVPFRAMLPLLCVGDEVLWIIGLAASEYTRRTDLPTTGFTIQGDMPWCIGYLSVPTPPNTKE